MTFSLKKATPAIIPLGIIGFSIFLALGSVLPVNKALATGITYDLLLTSPLVYFLLIRKRSIPNITVIPVFIIGLVVASLIIPAQHASHLSFAKSYVLPLVELTVFSIVITKVVKTVRTFKSHAHSNDSPDFLNILRETAGEVIPSRKVATLFSIEISMLYYALFSWKKRTLKPNEFSIYKDNASLATFGAIIFILLVETVVLHFLLIQWSAVVAWILFGLSIYTVLQLLGHVKAIIKRPALIANRTLQLKYGLFGDANIPLALIDRVEATTADIEIEGKTVENLSLLKGIESHNLAIHFKEPVTITKAYGMPKSCDVLLISIDQKQEFLKQVTE